MPRMAWGGWRLVNSVRSAGSSPAASTAPVLDPNWWQRWQIQGHNPSVVLDFANGLYYNGTATLLSPSTLMTNGTVTPGSGLLCNANNISLSGTALSAFQGGVYSLQTVTIGGTQGVTGALVTSSADGATMMDQILIQGTNVTNDVQGWKNSANAFVSATGNPYDFTKTLYWGIGTSTTGTLRTISGFESGAKGTGNDANPFAANPNSMFLGSLTPQFSVDFFGGFLQQLAIINGFCPSSGYQYLPPAWSGTNAYWYNFATANGISYGDILQYEYTQPWTVVAPIFCVGAAGGGTGGITGIIFSNVPPATPYPGYELWLDGTPNLRVRVINDFVNHLVDVVGSTNLNDGKWHVVHATYDGSGTAAGVNIYVDGVLETLTVISNTFFGGTNTTIAPGGNWYFIGNQSAPSGSLGTISTALALPGAIGRGFRQYNVVKPLSFIQQWQINQLLPAIDSSCVLAPALNEGGSNTTTADLSASGFTGTLTSSSCWLRG